MEGGNKVQNYILSLILLLTEERRWKRKKDKRRNKCKERERGGKNGHAHTKMRKEIGNVK